MWIRTIRDAQMWIPQLHRIRSLACSRSAVGATPWTRTAITSFCSEHDSAAGFNKSVSAIGEGEAGGVGRASGDRKSCDNPFAAWEAMTESLRRHQANGFIKTGGSDGNQLGNRGISELSTTSDGLASNPQFFVKRPQMENDSQQSKRAFDGPEGQHLAALHGNHNETWQGMNASLADRRSGIPQYADVGWGFSSSNDSSNDGSHMTAGTTLRASGVCFKCGQEGHWARDCPIATAGKAHIDGSEGLHSGAAIPDKNCPCGAGCCAVLISNTEKNPGRRFYRCPKTPEEGRCQFFEWCDEPSPKSSVPELKCPCGAGPCTVLTAKTEKNMGRQFYRCPKKQEGGGCGFFQWCDETNDTGKKTTDYTWKVGESSVPSGNPMGGSVRCFKCGVDGHWYKDCPSLLSVSPAATSDVLSALDKREVGFASTRSSSACFTCGQTGHWSKDCPSLYPRSLVHSVSSNDAASGNCFKCGGKGHWPSNCPGVLSSSGQIKGSIRGSGSEGESRSAGSCYNCGGEGHWASNCTAGGKGNKERSTYWMN